MKLSQKHRQKYPEVFIFHDRNRMWNGHASVLAGGQCTIYLMLEGGVAVVGQAQCVEKDQYSKKIGRSIAYGRALRAVRLLSNAEMVDRVNKAVRSKVGKINPGIFRKAYLGRTGQEIR